MISLGVVRFLCTFSIEELLRKPLLPRLPPTTIPAHIYRLVSSRLAIGEPSHHILTRWRYGRRDKSLIIGKLTIEIMCFEKKEQLLDFASNPSIFFDASRSKGLGLRLSQRQRIEVELISFLSKEISYLLWLFRHVELERVVICCIFAGPKTRNWNNNPSPSVSPKLR